MNTTRKRSNKNQYVGGKPSTRKLRVVKDINDDKEWFIGTAGLMTSKAKWFAQPELNLLEVNSTFYRLPGPRQLNAWKAFPEHISFVLKMSKYVTHIKRLKEPEEGVSRFLEAVAPLSNRTKGFLVQLPPTFVYNDVNMARLDHLYSLLPSKTKDIFVEFRDPSWHNTQVYEWFARKKWVIAGTWINKTAGTKYMGNMPGGLVMPGPKTTTRVMFGCTVQRDSGALTASLSFNNLRTRSCPAIASKTSLFSTTRSFLTGVNLALRMV